MGPATHDTIVVCRPHQFREAAIVLSCIPNGRLTPLIVIEVAPITESQYRERYAAYVEARNRRDALAQAARMSGKVGPDFAAAVAEVDRKAEALTSYRSWWRHQRLIADLIATITVSRAIYLFVPPREEVELINPVPFGKLSDERQPTIPDTVEPVYLIREGEEKPIGASQTYGSLADLAEVAWRACGRTLDASLEPIAVPELALGGYFAALYAALQSGRPLKPSPSVQPDSSIAVAMPNDAPAEAVLIEISADATKLLGVQYAWHRGAKLVLEPEPDARAIEAERASVERHVDDADKSNKAKASLLGRFREWLLGDPVIAAGVRRLERAVTAAVPDQVVKEVGDLPLTVFTSGIPYGFVKTRNISWAEKPIGHVSGDGSLLILTELLGWDAGRDVGFSLIFDPGHFETFETEYVLQASKGRFGHSMALRREQASSIALYALGPSLPLDLLFFNTHGSDKEILLSDLALPAWKLIQRVTFSSRPFVFNNSCLSWVGVGKEFVRAGARGYLGTLWSIDAEMAARYAARIVARTTQDGLPVSAAMHDTGVDQATARAYVFVGTCGARLGTSPAQDMAATRTRLAAAARSLLEETLRLFQSPEGRSSHPIMTSLQDRLWHEAETLLAEYDRLAPPPEIVRIDLFELQLHLLGYLASRHPAEVMQRAHIVSDALQLLDTVALNESARHEHRARLARFAGRTQLALGNAGLAQQILRQAVEEAKQSGSAAGPLLLDLSDTWRAMGRPREAREILRWAQTEYGKAAFSPFGRLALLGRLSQVSKDLGDLTTALGYAKTGFAEATALDIPGEVAEFKGDEARVLLRLNRLDEALAAARKFFELAAQAHDEPRVSDAYGVLAQILLAQDKPDEALEYATAGLAAATASQDHRAIRDFAANLANIRARLSSSGP